MNTSSRTTRRRRVAIILASACLPATPVALAMQSSSAGAAGFSAPVYTVVQEGLSPDQAKAIAERAGVGMALRTDGSFAFVDAARYSVVPTKVVGEGKDEHGNPTVSQAIDEAALKRLTVMTQPDAIAKAKELIPVSEGYEVTPVVGNTVVERKGVDSAVVYRKALDTTVSYQFWLGGVPVVGPGAKARINFAGDGSVVNLSIASRQVTKGAMVPIIGPDEAAKACATAYGKGDKLGTPKLVYYSPPLAAKEAGGVGVAKLLLPHYACQLAGEEDGPITGRLIPAAIKKTATIVLTATGDGTTISAQVSRSGGQGPFTYQWATTSAVVASRGTKITYPRPKRSVGDETVTVTVTDANGVAVSTSVILPRGAGEGSSTAGAGSVGGVGGELTFGVESPIADWTCAQNSSNGFRDVMVSHGQTKRFDWRGNNAWEKDFKDPAFGGIDSSYADNVDAAMYTGHGWPGGFTFNTNMSDTSITPSDGKWGNKDLEWLNLESCQVLRDTTGTLDHLDRWGPTFNGLHLINGFHTNASCISGTGRRFAEYLFPEKFLWWTVRDPLTVQQAWGQMANDLEPAGTRWRSMSPVSSTGVSNLGDHLWGQGSTGPDIYSPSGFVSISGVA